MYKERIICPIFVWNVKSMEEDILKYEPLVNSIASKFYNVPKEDLIQAGFLGLTKARENYNINSGCKFSTYAYQYIYGEMYTTAFGSKPIYVNKDAMRIYNKVKKARELMMQKENRNVTYDEVCKYLNIDINTFLDILNSLSANISIENTELNLTKHDNIDELILLKESLEILSSLEKSVMNMRYLNDLSQDETAKVLGLSQVRVSRIEKTSKEKMREFITN